MVHCYQNIWFNKRTHPNEYRKGHRLSTKWASDWSSVRSWPVQPIKELSSAARRCAGSGCALIRQLDNCSPPSCFVGVTCKQSMCVCVWTCCRHRRSSDRSRRSGEHDAHGAGEGWNPVWSQTGAVLHRCREVNTVCYFTSSHGLLSSIAN